MTVRGWPTDNQADPTLEVEWRYLMRWLMESGVLEGELSEFLVQQRAAGANMSVEVLSGNSFHVGHMIRSDATVSLAIANNGTGDDRIDLVVVGFDFAANTYTVYVKQGAAGGPVAPTLEQDIDTKWELGLAEVLVEAGESTSILDADITDVRVLITPGASGGGGFDPVLAQAFT